MSARGGGRFRKRRAKKLDGRRGSVIVIVTAIDKVVGVRSKLAGTREADETKGNVAESGQRWRWADRHNYNPYATCYPHRVPHRRAGKTQTEAGRCRDYSSLGSDSWQEESGRPSRPPWCSGKCRELVCPKQLGALSQRKLFAVECKWTKAWEIFVVGSAERVVEVAIKRLGERPIAVRRHRIRQGKPKVKEKRTES